MIDRHSHRNIQPRAIICQAALLLPVIGVLASCFLLKPVVGYRSLTIETPTLRAEWSDPILAQTDKDDRVLPVLENYYYPFENFTGAIAINHFSQKGAHSQRIRYTYLAMRPDHVIGESAKTREVLRGAFGEVFATKACYYNVQAVPGEQWSNHFDVQSYSIQPGFEPASVQAEKPADVAETLFYLSVVRVFRAAPEYLVISAVYAQNGGLRSVYINGSKGGDWIHPNDLTGFDSDAVTFGRARAPETLRHYGLPQQIDIQQYRRKFASPLAKIALESVTDAVNLHFNFGEWTRQDEFGPDGSHRTRYLTYVQTAEDRILEPVCNQEFVDEFKKGIDPPY
jgi:hypothetical protein